MAETGSTYGSLRNHRDDNTRLIAILLLSLLLHLMVWGGYVLGEKWHLLDWLRYLKIPHKTQKVQPLPPPVAQQDQPMMFLDVNPDQATPDAPKDAKYYSSQNSKAANPDAKQDSNIPKLDGKQTQVLKTEDAPRPNFNKLQPTATPAKEVQPEEQSSPQKMEKGDLTLAKPEDAQPKKENEKPQPRPRTIQEALAQQQNRLPGQQMRQDGGVRRTALVPSLDAKATPFGKYDAEFIRAVTQCWYDTLDNQQFAQDRSGKVTLHFRLHYDGRITDMSVLENTVGEMLCLICQKAVLDPAPYARWPSDMRRLIGQDYRDLTFTFYYY